MKILGLDTSCDDTSIALIDAKGTGHFLDARILANEISSQTKLHKKWGGVFPSLAKREHQKNLVPVMMEVLKKSKMLSKKTIKISKNQEEEITRFFGHDPVLGKKTITFLKKYGKPEIDAIAVTQGPGLEPCLWTGINFANALSLFWQIPLLAVNHIEAHICASWLEKNNRERIQFPALALIASGGHTQIIHIDNIGKYQIVGETRDDAAGECFDKVARILNLGYPGGAAMEKIAKSHEPKIKISLPRPMIKNQGFDFSFSGLKTAVFYDFLKKDDKMKKSRDYRNAVAIEAQNAIIDVLVDKTVRASKNFKVKTVIMGGGVSANDLLKAKMRQALEKENPGCQLIFPVPKFSTDNGAMVALSALLNPQRQKTIQAKSNLKI